MKANAGITLEADDMPNVVSALVHYEDSMLKYQQWIQTKEGKPLPGMETAIAEIQADLKVLRDLRLRIYETCFTSPTP